MFHRESPSDASCWKSAYRKTPSRDYPEKEVVHKHKIR